MAPRKRSNNSGKPGLTRTGIATTALRMIDEGGTSAFSMRRLGAELNVDPSALYWHFRGREDLFEAIAETLVDEVGAAGLPWAAPWSDLLTAYCIQLYEVLIRHPHAVIVFASRPVRSEFGVRAANHAIELMVASGFTAGQAMQAVQALRAYVVGCALDVSATAITGLQPRQRSARPPADNLLAQGVIDAGDHFRPGLDAMIRGLSA
ncbi:TetR family transcriptional regulator [Micromonospora zingiberis]|uniref:TetR family transcriptional regulator n=1 Tax=Micromonospora zingiberis TaxID=2053011 RepID=A0A4R0FYT2_9ACTN|nr:TetR/AcrR family transcriptional regulator C-terminal domain-containing protein [Micromonospora zingiberis]TCB88288.1 TetR family transcriptional regulator [Micromonospora zingiberis]